jgi:hypothetical protein
MTPILNTIAMVAIWLTAISICIDFMTLEKRMGLWELTHQGHTYIRRYRSLT